MSSHQTWDEEDYPSSGDEQRNERVRQARDRHTNNNVDRVRETISAHDSQNRAYVSALNTIRADPLVQNQLQRIEEIWTIKKDKVLADVLYTEVTLAIVQAANAVAKAGTNQTGEDEEHFAAVQSARSRTVGNFQWSEPSSASSSAEGTPTEEGELDFSQLKIRART